MATQVRIGFREAVGWIVSGAGTGPAGPVSLVLDGARVTVDAVDPRVLVELVIFADDRGDPVAPVALALTSGLLGAAVADALAGRPQDVTVLSVDTGAPAPLREQVARAARAQFLVSHDIVAPRLASWRLLTDARFLAPFGARGLLLEHAWEALPAAIALGRTAERRTEVISRLRPRQWHEIADALATLTDVLTGDQWDGTGRESLEALKRRLTSLIDKESKGLLERAGLLTSDDGNAQERAEMLFAEANGEPEVKVQWRAESRDLRTRLGDFAAEAFAGAFARGKIPDTVDVQLPLRLGAAGDAPKLVARVHSWSGEILGEEPMSVSALPGALPRARARIRVHDLPADLDLLRAHGVHIDIALADLAPLDVEGLRRHARIRARHVALTALVDRYAGNWSSEAKAWDHCARMYTIGADEGRASVARQQAAIADRRVAGGQPASGPDGRDWAGGLLDSWSSTARQEIGEATAAQLTERVQQLWLLVRDLSAGASGLPELADTRQALATALRENGTVSDRAAAVELLHEALRVRYLLATYPDAEDVVREITEAQAGAEAAASDEEPESAGGGGE